MNFKEKVQGMTANEIVAVMIEGLRNPITNIDMDTYGKVDNNNICYGCAATNTICKIANVSISKFIEIFNKETRFSFGEENVIFLSHFESAINQLRQGDIRKYNYYAKMMGIAEMKEIKRLPYLSDDYTEEQLNIYANTDFTVY
jgi:hypothetical protein